MRKDPPSPELLAAIEHALVEHQAFGDSRYILEQLELTHNRRLERVSSELPIARELLDACERADPDTRYRIAGNTVIRCALRHANTCVETGTPAGLPMSECEQVFDETLQHLRRGQSGTPFENGATRLDKLGPEPFHGWVWKEEYPDDVFGRSFRAILEQEYGDGLCTPSRDEFAMLVKGEQLLRELLPSLARSALTHAHLVGCFPDAGFWKGKTSSSQIRMGGTIFLSCRMLVSPWCVAEHLLHESLHQKLYDFRHGHSLLDPDHVAPEPLRVISIWNAGELNKANHWDTHRAFAAFHVYAQLALLATVAEQRAEELEETYGPFRGMVDSRKALERACYLGEKLKDVCWNELGVAGKRMRDWLMSVLDFVEPSLPPHGATIHLFLDLYQREANKVDSVLAEPGALNSSFPRRLAPVAKDEVAHARRVLASIGAGEELARFDDAVAQYTDEELGTHFPAVRRLIARTLLGASPDGYGLRSRAIGGSDPDTLVHELVEHGSEQLYLIQVNVPPAVAGAKRRAKDLRFTLSCDDGVGRLLAMLAAAVPPGGRVLEIGTGVGTGLAWIVTGLGDRTDAEVVSIEVEARLSNAARMWPWPSHVQILTADASELDSMLGTFSLIFLDAAEIKYRDVDAIIRMLRPGGMLVVDDFHEEADTSELQHAEKVALRRALLGHPALQAVELDWSSGVVLATMTAVQGSALQTAGAVSTRAFV